MLTSTGASPPMAGLVGKSAARSIQRLGKLKTQLESQRFAKEYRAEGQVLAASTGAASSLKLLT